jgi:ribonuclease HI
VSRTIYSLHIFGSCNNRNGCAGIAYVLCSPEGKQLHAEGEKTTGTSNSVQYKALFAGLSYALHAGIKDLDVFTTSDLLINQMESNFKTRGELARLRLKCTKLVVLFRSVEFRKAATGHKTAKRLATKFLRVAEESSEESENTESFSSREFGIQVSEESS